MTRVSLHLGVDLALLGAPALASAGEDHWAFRRLRPPAAPSVKAAERARNDVDRFILSTLEAKGLSLGPDADRHTLVRRVCYDLTGLPPTLGEVDAFIGDASPDAYERMVERYLASPRYGERWGQYWLDAAGYADSSGYFSNERPRPLAYRYRDYVIDSFNRDVPFDQFVREQLAGDEMVELRPDAPATDDVMRSLVATQYLANAPDGTDQSAPSPDAMRIDRYAALEGTQQVVASSLLGLTLKCARCHDHKFEPITQREYYQVQAILLPALNPAEWVPPLKRTVRVQTPEDFASWQAHVRDHQTRLASLRDAAGRMAESVAARRREMGPIDFDAVRGQPAGDVATVFTDAAAGEPVAVRWSLAAPPANADAAALAEPVVLDAEVPGRHCAVRDGTKLRVIARKHCESLLATRQQFDWTPNQPGHSIEATFDLVADRAAPADTATPATQYFGYLIAARDSLRPEKGKLGNVLIDGNVLGHPNVYFDYPGPAARKTPLGTTTYRAGHTFGVRVTNAGDGRFELLHLTDGLPDGDPITLAAGDLPDGAFSFYFGADRSFVVDNVTVRSGSFSGTFTPAEQLVIDDRRRAQFEQGAKRLEASPPEKQATDVSWVSDRAATPPKAFVLKRGAYGLNGEEVQPAGLAVLTDADNPMTVSPSPRSTGRRLAFARWLTKPGSRPAALMARVQADRVWRNHFGRGLVPTPDNFGTSGTPPTHPDLLEHLAASLADSGWRIKDLHRRILLSSTYRQSSLPRVAALEADPSNTAYWRFPLRRLDAEAIRDSMLAVSGELDPTPGGPAVPIERSGTEQEMARGALSREIVVNEKTPGARRRSIYLQHVRGQLPTVLALFGTPVISVNCVERSSATVPLQSLAQLNSDFARVRARAMAERLTREAGDVGVGERVALAYRLALARPPTADELGDASAFIIEQRAAYALEERPDRSALADFCQMLLAGNAFLYVE
jgi:hypothetical protein